MTGLPSRGRPGDDALHDALRLRVDHADRVAERAGVLGLAAQGQGQSGRLINEGHGVVALHDRRLGQIGVVQRLSGPQLMPRGRCR